MIGSYLVDLLQYINQTNKTNMHIFAMSRSAKNLTQRFGGESDTLKLVVHDLSLPFNTTQHFDYIIHAGGANSPSEFANNPVDTMKTTLVGTMSLLDVAKRDGAHFTFISTGEVYGRSNEQIFDESNPGCVDTKNPRACYPESRRAAETLCVAYGKQYGVPFNVARLGYVFGPTVTDNSDLAVAQFLRNAVNGQDIVLKSSGKQIRTWLYVADAVSGILHIILNGKSGEFYNVAGSTASLKSFAETLAKIADINVKCENVSGADADNSVLSSEKLHKLGWQQLFPIHDALKATYIIKKNQMTK